MGEGEAWTISDYLESHASNRGSRIAARSGSDELTWHELERRSRQVALALVGDGGQTGDRVAVVMSNGIAALEVIVGVMRAGQIVVPFNTTLTDDTLMRLITDAGATTLVATADHAGRFGPLPQSIRRISEGEALPGWLPYAQWREAPMLAALPAIASHYPCNIIYSSGTTGMPKGIVHTHQGRIDFASDLAVALDYRDGANTLIITGLYSNISWVGILCTILVGGTIHIHRQFDPKTTLLEIEHSRITNMSAVPLQYQRMLAVPELEHVDTGSLRALMCCGSPLPIAIKQQLLSQFACGVTDLYGLTEGVATTLAPHDAPSRLASVGRPIPGNEIRLIDDDDASVDAGRTGEIVGRSRFAMAGYWNNPDATDDATWIDEKGRSWFRTGDIGRFDEDGFLYIVDRKKDMILSGGQNVYPADLEAVLYQHDDVAECAVIGLPDAEWGERPLALVVLRHKSAIASEVLRNWANAHLGKQQRIACLEIVSDLPRNANGKILKTELRRARAPLTG